PVGPTCGPIGVSVAAEATFPVSSKASSFKQIAIQVSRKAREAEVEQRFISLLTPEIQEAARASSNIYDSFAKILNGDYIEKQELNKHLQRVEAILLHNTKLQDEIQAAQKEMYANQKEMYAKQEE
ncbi:hypothetical protein BGW38_010320, partial [Lunasporangiospora selenospora]